MNASHEFPSFEVLLPDLNKFVLELVEDYHAGKINSWEGLEEKVNAFFTPERMEQIESLVPGWCKMATYLDGVTLTHVICVFLGLVMLPEYQSMSLEQQQLAKWIVLFHDVEKEIKKGERDPKHGFRSAVITAKRLPYLGFAVTADYDNLITSWSEFTYSAIRISEDYPEPIQDNQKLPEILAGIDRMFGKDAPAGLIVKAVLLHMSINVVGDWPQAAPLTEKEIKMYVKSNQAPLLKVMMLADNEGWSIFYSDREQQRKETLEVFQKIEKLISS